MPFRKKCQRSAAGCPEITPDILAAVWAMARKNARRFARQGTGSGELTAEEFYSAGLYQVANAAWKFDASRSAWDTYARVQAWRGMQDYVKHVLGRNDWSDTRHSGWARIRHPQQDGNTDERGRLLRDGQTLVEARSAVRDDEPDAIRREYLLSALRCLTHAERSVIVDYYLHGLPLKKAAKKLGLSESRGSQLKDAALRVLRETAAGRLRDLCV